MRLNKGRDLAHVSTTAEEDYYRSYTANDSYLNLRKTSSLETEVRDDEKGRSKTTPQTPQMRRRTREKQINDAKKAQQEKLSISDKWKKVNEDSENDKTSHWMSSEQDSRPKLSSSDYWKHLREDYDVKRTSGDGKRTNRTRTRRKKAWGKKESLLDELAQDGVPVMQWFVVLMLFVLSWHFLFRSREPSSTKGFPSKQKKAGGAFSTGVKKKGKKKNAGRSVVKTKRGNRPSNRANKGAGVSYGGKENNLLMEKKSKRPLGGGSRARDEMEYENVHNASVAEKSTPVKGSPAKQDRAQDEKDFGSKSSPNKNSGGSDSEACGKERTAGVHNSGRGSVSVKRDKELLSDGKSSGARSALSTPDSVSTDGSSLEGGSPDFVAADDEGEWTTVGSSHNAVKRTAKDSPISSKKNTTEKFNSGTRGDKVARLKLGTNKREQSSPQRNSDIKDQQGGEKGTLEERCQTVQNDILEESKTDALKEASGGKEDTNEILGSEEEGGEENEDYVVEKSVLQQGKESSEETSVEDDVREVPAKERISTEIVNPTISSKADVPIETKLSEEDDAALARLLQKEEELAANAEAQNIVTSDGWEEVTSKKRKNRKKKREDEGKCDGTNDVMSA